MNQQNDVGKPSHFTLSMAFSAKIPYMQCFRAVTNTQIFNQIDNCRRHASTSELQFKKELVFYLANFIMLQNFVRKISTSRSCFMLYTLNDGREVDLSRVMDVSAIRDEGLDPSSISNSRIAFHIRVKSGSSILVEKKYHFADWAAKKKELDLERKAFVNALEQYRAEKQ